MRQHCTLLGILNEMYLDKRLNAPSNMLRSDIILPHDFIYPVTQFDAFNIHKEQNSARRNKLLHDIGCFINSKLHDYIIYSMENLMCNMMNCFISLLHKFLI